MSRIDTAIDIAAPPPAVWEVLTRFEAYPKWNPFVRRISGEIEVGARLTVQLGLGRRPITIQPMVVGVVPGEELRWLGHLFVPGLFDGEHRFRVEPLADGGTRFVHDESFQGLLVGIVLAAVRGQTEAGFRAMNEALRDRCTTG